MRGNKCLTFVLGGIGGLLLFIIPFILIIAIIIAITGRFGSIQETQRDFLRALFDRSVPISDFIDGTPEGQQAHDFIIFARRELAQIENEALLFFRTNEIINLEIRTDLSRTEARESPNIMPETAILRMKVVYYSLFLHEFSPLPIHANEDEIWAYMEHDTGCYMTANHNPWHNFMFHDYAGFVRSFFELEPSAFEPEAYLLPSHGRFLWERVENGADVSPFFNSIIYQQIHANVHRTVTTADENLIEIIWDALTRRSFVHFTGRFATPIDPQFMNNITSPFGYRSDPFTGERSFHGGVDFAWAGCYGANIYAVYEGIVLQAHDRNNGFGITVLIEHPNGWRTLYAHASQAFVRVGEEVETGQLIAAIGSTGRSTGPHLHFELHIGGNRVDPMQLFY